MKIRRMSRHRVDAKPPSLPAVSPRDPSRAFALFIEILMVADRHAAEKAADKHQQKEELTENKPMSLRIRKGSHNREPYLLIGRIISISKPIAFNTIFNESKRDSLPVLIV